MDASTTLPAHVAIIMDGNGRWAKARGLPRSEGHKEGTRTAKRIVAEADRLGLKFLSLYVFSTENWKRAKDEVGFLMGLLNTYLCAEFDFYRDNDIRLVHSGDRSGLPSEVLESIDGAIAETAAHTGLCVNLAINYGGRDEIIRAARAVKEKGLPVTEESLRSCFDNPCVPDPDLIIRTGQELRMSNFLLWQSAYSELYFSDKLWPDWAEADLRAALDDYAGRERRFGNAR